MSIMKEVHDKKNQQKTKSSILVEQPPRNEAERSKGPHGKTTSGHHSEKKLNAEGNQKRSSQAASHIEPSSDTFRIKKKYEDSQSIIARRPTGHHYDEDNRLGKRINGNGETNRSATHSNRTF